VSTDRQSEYAALWKLDGERISRERVTEATQGVMVLLDALSRAKNGEQTRELECALRAARHHESLALHVVCALNRVEQLRDTLNAICDALGYKSYSEALAYAATVRRVPSDPDASKGTE